MADGAHTYLKDARGDNDLTGADATYSVPLEDGRTAWIFGDSFIGGVQPDGSRSTDPHTFVRNSIVLQDGPEDFRLVTGRRADGVPIDAALPPGMQENRDGKLPDQWYWPGHGVARGNELLVFMNRFDQPADSGLAWSWRYHGTDLARFDATTGALHSTTPIVADGGDVLWGAAVLERGAHTYIYGAEDDPAAGTRHAHVARAPREQLAEADAWRFWDGNSWSRSSESSARIGAAVSPQFGAVDARDGSTLLISQDGLGGNVRAWQSDAPHGPFVDRGIVAEVPAQPRGRHTYNAVPHPQLTTEDGLLVSFNVGGADFMADHESYRPGFLRIPNEKLPGGGIAESKS